MFTSVVTYLDGAGQEQTFEFETHVSISGMDGSAIIQFSSSTKVFCVPSHRFVSYEAYQG